MTDLEAAIRRTEQQLRQMRKARNKGRAERAPKLPEHQPIKPDLNEEAQGYMAWIHEQGLPCIGCLIEGTPSRDTLQGHANPLEVAHQKRNDPREGWQSNRAGKRVGHRQSVPLCWWHHQGAPNACDAGQAKFWDRLGVDVVELCRSLFAAFKSDSPGDPVIHQFAQGRGS